MTLDIAMRWMMTFGTGMALLAGSAAAQETATSSKSQQQAPAVSKPEPTAPTVRKTQEKAQETKPEQAAPAPQQDPAFQNWRDKLSYAIGADLARGLRWQRVDVNMDVLVGALRDALAGKKLVMTQEEVTATLKRFENEKKKITSTPKRCCQGKTKRRGTHSLPRT